MRITVDAAKAALVTLIVILAVVPGPVTAQEATPAAYNCDSPMTGVPMAEMPMAAMGNMPMMTGTPMAGMGHMMPVDQMYIDMMIPHHQSIIAMAEAAMPRLTDERLREIAQAVIATQRPEIDALRDYRQQLFGDSMPMPMDSAMMEAMMQIMPGMPGTMPQMASMMNAGDLVATFCAAENPDLAFIDLVITHHQMAIAASQSALAQADNQEIQDIAQDVIDAQQLEIETLVEIRAEIAGEATPAGS
jgi:uncharacterized protein (DUF305 family)